MGNVESNHIPAVKAFLEIIEMRNIFNKTLETALGVLFFYFYFILMYSHACNELKMLR